MPYAIEQEVVSISYQDLLKFASKYDNNYGCYDEDDESLLSKIGLAFGNGGKKNIYDDVTFDNDDPLGIIAVTDVPNVHELRSLLLPMARQISRLPEDELNKIISEESQYQVGWSHGKEKVEGDKFDTSKGSFYANPLADNVVECIKQRDSSGEDSIDDNDAVNNNSNVISELDDLAKENPLFFAPNVWPSNTVIPKFESTFKKLGQLICNVGRLVIRPCDEYVARDCNSYEKGKLVKILDNSLVCKARLLHYFAIDKHEMSNNSSEKFASGHDDNDYSNWCGWHNDHGSLTGLVPGMFLDDETGDEIANISNYTLNNNDLPGLYIKSRSGELIRAKPPKSNSNNTLLFQIGETSQIHSGGVLVATPHAVRGCVSGGKVSRESYAVFMEPEFFNDMSIPIGSTIEQVQSLDINEKESAQTTTPSSLRTLRTRWRAGMTFGEFTHATLNAFH